MHSQRVTVSIDGVHATQRMTEWPHYELSSQDVFRQETTFSQEVQSLMTSCDLRPLDLFLCGYVKNIVYKPETKSVLKHEMVYILNDK